MQHDDKQSAATAAAQEKIIEEAMGSARANVGQCALELLEWQETGRLRDGQIRTIARGLKALKCDHLDLARRCAERAVLQYMAADGDSTFRPSRSLPSP